MSNEELKPVNRRLRIAIISAVALVAVLAVVVTTNSGGDDDNATTTGTTAAPAPGGTGGKLTASDQGVTATEVKIATFTIAKSFLDRYGYVNPNIDKSVPAYAADINAKGGINGRRWVPDLIEIADPTDPSVVAQGCRAAFVDHKAFAIVNALAFPGLAECAARYGRVATDLGFGGVTTTSAALLEELDGHYWIGGMSSDNFTKLWVQQLAEDVGTSTKTVIIQRQDPQLVLARQQMSDALVDAGFPKPLLIQTAADPATAAIQISDGVAKAREEKVELVIPMVPAVAMGIIQNGFTNSDFRPAKGFTYSTVNGLDSADVTKFYVAKQMDGARGVSLFRGPTEAAQKPCRDVYLAAEPSETFQQATADMCQMMTQLADAMKAAGTNLTTASLITGYGSLGSREGNSIAKQSYSPTKFDGADQVRIIEFGDGTTSPVGSFRSSF